MRDVATTAAIDDVLRYDLLVRRLLLIERNDLKIYIFTVFWKFPRLYSCLFCQEATHPRVDIRVRHVGVRDHCPELVTLKIVTVSRNASSFSTMSIPFVYVDFEANQIFSRKRRSKSYQAMRLVLPLSDL